MTGLRLRQQLFLYMTKLKLFFLACLTTTVAAGQSVNWAHDVAPILYKHCVQCHRDGGLGHFSLVGYNNAYTYRESISHATETRQMPPWKPDPEYSRFAHENRLTNTEIETIRKWVEADAPAGDLNAAPDDPVVLTGSAVGMPDQVLKTPLYTISATQDEYRCFVIPNGLSQTSYLRGLEAIPGNHEVVHHILIYEDATGKGRQLDAQTPEAGYVNFGGPGVSGARLVGAWVPGSRTELLPPFMGIKLSPGADLIVQMHYPAGTTGMSDQTTLNLFFTPTNQGVRELSIAPLINHTPLSLENYPLSIPANQVKSYHAKFKVPQNGSIVAVGPHMHLIGRNITCFGVTPQGDTMRLIRINDWDFHWQGSYTFQKVKKIPAGTTVHAYATYDNTVNNPHQPSDPPLPVEQGEATTDEMMLVYFAYMGYLPGDENIVLDSTLLTSSAIEPPPLSALAIAEIAPNPASGRHLNLHFSLTEATAFRVDLFDMDGRLQRRLAADQTRQAGEYREQYEIGDTPAGVYYLRFATANGAIRTLKAIIMEE